MPDASNAVVAIGGVVKDVRDALQDDEWLDGAFVTTVQKRGAAIIEARKASSAMSAANAIGDHLRSWLATGTKEDDFVSLAVISDGSYGIAPGIVYSFPVQCKGDGSYTIVQVGLRRTSFSVSPVAFRAVVDLMWAELHCV